MVSVSTLSRGCGAALCMVVLGACSSGGKEPVYQQEQFTAGSNYSRKFAASPQATCEAARRTLLSQGYVIGEARADAVEAKKTFQPEKELHVELNFRVTCAPDRDGSVAFANAEQNRYTIKKTNSAASVGVGMMGSISLPLAGSDDSLVKVGAETIPPGSFYDRFFALLQHQLDQVPRTPLVTPATPPTPLPSAPAVPGTVPVTVPLTPSTPAPADRPVSTIVPG